MVRGDIIRLPGRQTSTGKMSHCLKMEPLAESATWTVTAFGCTALHLAGYTAQLHRAVKSRLHCKATGRTRKLCWMNNVKHWELDRAVWGRMCTALSPAICLVVQVAQICGFWWQNNADWKELPVELNNDRNFKSQVSQLKAIFRWRV